MPPPFAEVSDHLFAAINERAFPAAAIEIGGQKGVLWRRALGFLTYEPSAGLATADTIFDLASLTKVLATTSLAMRAIDDGRLRLEDTVERWIPEWKGNDRRGVTIADLLSHSSGLTAYLPFYRDCTGRIDYQPAICGVPLEYAPRTRSIYSDLGFMLLGFVLEDAQRRSDSFTWSAGGQQIPDAGSTRNSDGLQLSSPPSHWDSARREAGGTARRRRRWIPGEGGSSSARSMTRTRGLSAASRVMLACSERLPPLERSRAPCSPRSTVNQSWQGPIPCGDSSSRQECQEARVRSDGTPCCRHRRAARACLRPRSATPDSPAHRSGSTGSATSMLSC